jgi:hypothetical protein
MPAQTNSKITAIAGSGSPDDWDRPATDGDDKWTGEVRAYYREKTDRVVKDGEVNLFTRRTLIVDVDDLDRFELDTDDTITFVRDGGATTTGTAVTITRADLANVPRELRTARIELEPA